MISLKKKTTVIIILITLFLISLGSFAFFNLGNWILVNDPLPEKLAVIFTFAGENVRDIYSQQLAEEYSDAVWVISGRNKIKYFEKLTNENFDTSRIFFVDTCTTTFSEVMYLKKWLNDYTNSIYKSGNSYFQQIHIGLVSGPYHMRRISILVERIFKNNKNNFYYLSVPFDRYNHTSDDYGIWWKHKVLRKILILETQKIVYDLWRIVF